MIQSLNALTQIGKAIIDARGASIIRNKVFELNREILSAQAGAFAAQADQFALLERIRALEKHIVELETWDAEAKKYELKNLPPGGVWGGPIFAYTLKKEASPSEPDHLLCAQCYEERHKSILQSEMLESGRCDVLTCHRCSSILYLTGYRRPEHSKIMLSR